MTIPKKEFFQNTSLVFFSILIALLAGELIVRDYRAGFKNMIAAQGQNLIEFFFPGLYSVDPRLGWLPNANVSQIKWNNNQVSTLDDGIRSNGNPKSPPKRPLVLALGDSFTFGDQVSDSQTWPAYLERITGWRVLNAGVSSYGLDQIVLRAEQLVPKYRPDVIIVSLIYDDLERCRQTVRHGVPKPYFMIENHKLVLRNVSPSNQKHPGLDWFRSVFGYSHLAHKIMDRLFPQYWWEGTLRDYRYTPQNSPPIVIPLLNRLANVQREGTRLIILLQGDVNTDRGQALGFRYIFSKLSANKMEVVNLIPLLVKIKEKDRDNFNLLFARPPLPGSHMTPLGNAWVARNVSLRLMRK